MNRYIYTLFSVQYKADRQAVGTFRFREAGFQPKLWDAFAEAMIHCTVGWGDRHKRNSATQEAWTKIVLFIIDRMRDGYYREVRNIGWIGDEGGEDDDGDENDRGER